MRIKGSYITAALILAGIAGWMASGAIGRDGADAPADETAQAAPAGETAQPFAVRVRTVTRDSRSATLQVKGRTEARARVEVKAETGARVLERPIDKGARVEAGDLLCRLDAGAREARLLQAEAQLAQAQFDYDGANRLSESGFAARARLESLKAALDSAKAAVKEAEVEMERTAIRAPVAGLVDAPIAELGDTLAVGTTCATLVALDPLLAIGQVSERDVGALEIGMPVRVVLVTGQEADGTLRFIGSSADPETRTFRVEAEVENDDFAIRDGVTARIAIALAETPAHLVPRSALVLDEAGRVGVRTVEAENTVAFHAVRVLGDEGEDGIWVAGLPESIELITLGQGYVSEGTTVTPRREETNAPGARTADRRS